VAAVLGIYRDAEEAARTVSISSREVSPPSDSERAYYRRAYESVYRKLYPQLAPLSHEIEVLGGVGR
jgi:sugar (pentulose or hexulose) kinase